MHWDKVSPYWRQHTETISSCELMDNQSETMTKKLDLLDSNLMTRSTMYTSLEAIDQGHISTTGFVKAAGRKRLVDWYQNLSIEYHGSKPRLGGKGNGAMPIRAADLSSSLEQRSLEIGKKDFRIKKKRAKVNPKDEITLHYKAQRRISKRLLNATSTSNNVERSLVDDATRQYMLQLSKSWQQYYHARTGKNLQDTCWIGAPVLHHDKAAIICGATKAAWRLFRIDTATLLYVAKKYLLQVEIPNEDNGTSLQFNISV